MMPSDDSVWPIFERPSSTMIRKSQASASSLPPPIAWPLIAAITGLGHFSIAENRSWLRFMTAAICSAASGALRSIVAMEPRSAPTLKYFSYSDTRTITRTEASSPSSWKAAASSCIRSSAIALLPLRCMTTRAIAPSRLMSMHSPISSGREQRDAAGDFDHRAGDVTGLFRAEERDGVGDIFRLAETLEDRPCFEPRVHRVGRFGCRARLGHDDAGSDRVRRDVVAPAFQGRRLGKSDQASLRG